jgi:glycosyltransferase involved in cell wall biosynthesis
MKKIICCVTNDLSFDQRMMRICESLVSFGYSVLLCGRELPLSIPLESKSYRQHRFRCIFRKGKFFYIEYNIRLFLFLMSEDFDAVNIVDLDTAVGGLLAAVIKRKKVVYDAHEWFPEVPEVVHRPFTKKVWQIVERFVIARADLAYTVSDGLANIFKEKYGKHFFVIRNIPLLKPPLDTPKQKAIIYQGALNEGRGLEFLIDAMQKIDTELWLAGEGDVANKLKQQVQRLQLQEKVIFLGRLPPPILFEKTQQAMAGFNVLEAKGFSYFYSLGNKTFDYIHAEIPQVISAFPEMKKLNEQFLFALELENLSSEEISRAFHCLLCDEELYATLRENCRKAKQVLNWQQESLQLKQVYEQLFR